MPGEKTRVRKGWAVVLAPAVAAEDGMDLLGTADADVVGTRASKNPRARRGSSKTRVRETSTWRMESSQK